MNKYSAFLKAMYEGLVQKGTPPNVVVVHPDNFDTVQEALNELGIDITVIEDSDLSGRKSVTFAYMPDMVSSNN